jgi:phosphatidylglycerol---prolipoprotein diacylglyceryl transferase
MRPILFRIRGVPIHAYPAMLYLGLVCGVLAGNVAAHAAGVDAFRVYVATMILIPIALVGARLLFVACQWTRYRHNPRRIFDRSEGGAAQYGGLILVLPLSAPLLAAMGVGFGAFWDIGAITILVGMIFTRVGCLLNGCCSGRPARIWGSLYLPNHAGVWEQRIPTQILEGGLGAMLLAFALAAWRRMPFDGALFAFVVGGYGCGRLVLESARERDPGRRAFTIQHAISLVMVAVSLTVLTARWPR